MRRGIRIALGSLAAVVALGALAGFWLLRMTTVPEPSLRGALAHGSLESGGRTRTFSYYAPPDLPAGAPLVLAFHGSLGDGAQMRAGFGYDLDRLADRDGFVAVYPDGYERHWNDCRRAGPYAANALDVDDVAFSRALVDTFSEQLQIDRSRVFATGASNGGQMALRLALEAPDLVRAVAPLIASLPAGNNLDCRTEGRPVSVLVINGTEDPMNPYAGGRVALYGLLGDRGDVLSTDDTVDYFRELDGLPREPVVEALPDRDPDDGSRATRLLWERPGHKRVELLRIEGGGHTVPHPVVRMPRLIGRTNGDFSAAEEIWAFFSTAP